MSTSEARALAEQNQHSFLWVDKPEIAFPDSHDQYANDVYLSGRAHLQRLRAGALLEAEASACLYLYRLTMQGRSQTGLVCTTSVDEYLTGRIKKHEHTRPEKVNDRANHIAGTEAQCSPVFSTFRQTDRVRTLLSQISGRPALVDFVAPDLVRHELWRVSDDDMLQALTSAFAAIDVLYIADGHHRSEAAAEHCRRMRQSGATDSLAPFNFFLNGLFPDDELLIMPYNRVIRDLGGLTFAQVLDRAAASFTIEPSNGVVEPTTPHTFGMYHDRQWYQLTCTPGSFEANDPVASIDAAILGANLIAPILGIENPRTDKRIDFVGGIRGTAELERLVNSGRFQLAFSLCATTISQLLRVADAGTVMPPKSTWFEPKLISGLLVHSLIEQES